MRGGEALGVEDLAVAVAGRALAGAEELAAFDVEAGAQDVLDAEVGGDRIGDELGGAGQQRDDVRLARCSASAARASSEIAGRTSRSQKIAALSRISRSESPRRSAMRWVARRSMSRIASLYLASHSTLRAIIQASTSPRSRRKRSHLEPLLHRKRVRSRSKKAATRAVLIAPGA